MKMLPETFYKDADPWQAPPLSPLPPGWACDSTVRDRFLVDLKTVVAGAIPPPRVAEGDGIVICGGGSYWVMVCVAVRMCRLVTALPIQVWHRGDDEPIDPDALNDVPLVTFHSTLDFPARIQGGWNSKSIAMLNCGFARVLYLDADAYLTADPSPCFAKLSAEIGFLFWEDIPSRDSQPGWHWFGLPDLGKVVPRVQGGQIFLDRVRCWRQLVVFHWLCQHSEYSFHWPEGDQVETVDRHGYGDQDQWRMVLGMLPGRHFSLGPGRWVRPAFHCFLENHRCNSSLPVVVHRCQSKWWGKNSDERANHLAGEAQAWAFRDRHVFRPGRDAAEVFQEIYDSGWWGQIGSSGGGSSTDEAAPFAFLANHFLQASGATSIVDLGCGDGRVAATIIHPNYTGVDVSRRHVLQLQRTQPTRTWLVMDLDRQRNDLPAGDVAIMKDVLHHWPNWLVVSFLQWAKTAGKWRALLLCNDCLGAQNGWDCQLGSYRPLDLAIEPLASVQGLQEMGRFLHKAILWLPTK